MTRSHMPENEGRELNHLFEEVVYDHNLDHKTESFDLQVTPEGTGQRLRIRSHTADPGEGFCRAGCFIQGIAPVFPGDVPSPSPASPVISCIILLTFNCYFVERFLIPAIAAYTTEPYEIIIVYNGVATDLSRFGNYQVIASDTGWVAKGYNRGVTAARGRYVAIFHDDCLVLSPGWDRRMIGALDAGVIAVSTESVDNPNLGIEFLKGTPLVMTKSDYERMGGHDENFFGGIEDLDFSFRIQAQGYSVRRIGVAYRHFRGMSTVILLSGRAGEMRTLFGYCLVPENVIEDWKGRYAGARDIQDRMRAVNRENLAYFRQKCSASADMRALTSQRAPLLSATSRHYEQWLARIF